MVKEDLVREFKNFFLKEFLDKGSNASYISLIPKKNGAEEMSDFWPVSLLGNTYKIISKYLASKHKMVLPSVVTPAQGAFLEGRTYWIELHVLTNALTQEFVTVFWEFFAKWIRRKHMIM